MLKSKNILFMLSGSIAVNKSLQLLLRLKKEGANIIIACTETTFNFVSKEQLEKLTSNKVIHKNFQNELDMEHIHLGRWADLTLLCPATANTINQFAQGVGDNILGTLFLAYELGKKPFVIAPAMNTQMYKNPSTQASIGKLKNWGLDVLPTDFGTLACGEVGEGRLLEPDHIYDYVVNNYFSQQERKKILITSGATKEPIDGVRFITNFSTGKTGAKISDIFTQKGHDVTLLKADNAQSSKYNIETQTFSSFNDLDSKIKSLLSNNKFDAVIMTAAISDYSVEKIMVKGSTQTVQQNSKLSSDNDLTLTLKQNFKIINKIKSYSKNKNINIISFKLTKTKLEQEKLKAVNKIFQNPDIKYVVHNDLNKISDEQHWFNFYSQNKLIQQKVSILELTHQIEQAIMDSNHNSTNKEIPL